MAAKLKLHRWADIRARGRAKLTLDEIKANDEWVQRELLEMSLKELREMSGLTQIEAASAARMAQSDLSKLERREDFKLSTLRRYIEALGGELDVVARFGDRMVRVRGV